ncbi:MAG: SUMF1/EgtB/PvdO family nonheme iron enzyme [Chitinophagales bacterium]|nr:SUMF1/EgtB/PvdO family nonheme iron enzyme [Chitinophagales bacterium]
MHHLYLLLFCCLTIYNITPVSAQSPLGNNYAYFFYVTDFRPGWDDLPETKDEAILLGNTLETEYNFEVVYFANPSKKDMLNQIAKINSDQFAENDQILFFFSMHGYFDKATKRGYLIPSDGMLPAQDPYGQSWLSYDDLGNYITKNPAEHILLALDACYSGAFGNRYKGRPETTPWGQNDNCHEKVKQALNYDSRLYFSSGSKDQRTPAHSLFAEKWLEALRKGEEEGFVRFNDLRYYLGDINYPSPEGGSFSGRHEAGGDFIFIHKSACVNDTQLAIDKAEALLWDQAIQLDTKEAFTFYLQVYPEGKHKKKAVERINAFLELENQKSKASIYEGYEVSTEPGTSSMAFIKGGTFQMGYDDTKTKNKAPTISVDDFYMDRYEVTNAKFAAFLNSEGNQAVGGANWYKIESSNAKIEKYRDQYQIKRGYEKHPVVEVSWYGAIAYCNWLSKKEHLTPVYSINGTSISINWDADGYRLPSETEWEYAARSGGRDDRWAGTSSKDNLMDFANYWTPDNNDIYEETTPVGHYYANNIGLYDMSGNVWEWCWDWYKDNYYKKCPSHNPRGPILGSEKVVRGGSWSSDPDELKCNNRNSYAPIFRLDFMGFRVCKTAK